jgi:hypothetical protein
MKDFKSQVCVTCVEMQSGAYPCFLASTLLTS